MSRTTVIAMRYSSLAIALSLSGIYVNLVFPLDQNMIDLRACVVVFLTSYLLMATGLLVLNRLRKFDIALICWAALSAAIICQLGMYKMGLAPIPHLSQLISGVMGILASLLPVCIANIRGEVRQDRQNMKYVAARKMISGTTPLIGN